MAKQKRQHYLPRFYLEGFTDSIGSFFIYDRDKNEFREQTPINTAVEKDYYTIIDNSGEKNSFIWALVIVRAFSTNLHISVKAKDGVTINNTLISKNKPTVFFIISYNTKSVDSLPKVAPANYLNL